MILLTSTSQILEVVTSAAGSVDYTASYVDHTTSAGTPGSGQGNIATATTTTVVTAPAASTQRQIKHLSVHNSHGSVAQVVTVQKDVSSTNVLLFRTTLAAGESLNYSEAAGWQVHDANGRLRTRPSVASPAPLVRLPAFAMNASLSGTKSLTSTTAFAYYVGKAPSPLSAVQVRLRVTTAYGADGATPYAEIALAKGTPVLAGNPSLTVVGHANVAAVINSTGQKSIDISVAGGQSVDEGDDLWIVFGVKATTTAVLRALSIADDLQAGFMAAATTTQPSAIVGTPTSFTVEGATVLSPWFTVSP